MLKICTLASGSSGNCTYVSDGKTHMLIDAGISARAITNSLRGLGVEAGELSAILITHEHWDHIRGLEVFEKKNPVPIYASSENTAQALKNSYPLFSRQVFEFEEEHKFLIGEIEITAFRTPHDTENSVGFRIETGTNSILYATDLGHIPQCLEDKIIGAELALIEANYDDKSLEYGPYPPMLKKRIAGKNGHLSNYDCASCAVHAAKNGTKHIILGHLSKENNSPTLAYNTVHRALTEAGFIPGVDVMLEVSPRSECGKIHVLE